MAYNQTIVAGATAQQSGTLLQFRVDKTYRIKKIHVGARCEAAGTGALIAIGQTQLDIAPSGGSQIDAFVRPLVTETIVASSRQVAPTIRQDGGCINMDFDNIELSRVLNPDVAYALAWTLVFNAVLAGTETLRLAVYVWMEEIDDMQE